MRKITQLTLDALKRTDRRNFETRRKLLEALRIYKEHETEECKRYLDRYLREIR